MRYTTAFLALSLLTSVFAQTHGPDTDVTQPPSAHKAFEATGKGVQIYNCVPQGALGNWVFKAPEATLTDASGTQVATHAAAPDHHPIWTAPDGSSITGTVLQRKTSPDPLSVPWLLLSATPAPGHSGAMSNIAFVRRSDTHGGVPPADGCDAAHANATLRVPYSATYTFYTAAK